MVNLNSSIRNVFPKTKWISSLFHFAQCQVKHLKKVIDEATASTSDVTPAGDLAWPAFADAETTNHKNICADKNLMKGGVTGVK